jgi:hypothetical protein
MPAPERCNGARPRTPVPDGPITADDRRPRRRRRLEVGRRPRLVTQAGSPPSDPFRHTALAMGIASVLCTLIGLLAFLLWLEDRLWYVLLADAVALGGGAILMILSVFWLRLPRAQTDRCVRCGEAGPVASFPAQPEDLDLCPGCFRLAEGIQRMSFDDWS